MPIAIVTATVREMKAALAPAGPLPALERGSIVSWEHDGREFLLVVTGLGVINSALVLGRALERNEISGVLNMGLAGSFDLATLPLLVPCVVNEEIWPEYGLLGENGLEPRGLGFSLGTVQGEPVWERIEIFPDAAAEKMGLKLPGGVQTATSLTVSGVTGTRERAVELVGRYVADIENMEGFALAYACALSSVPFLELRVVSNLVGSRENEHWNLSGALGQLGKAYAKIFRPA